MARFYKKRGKSYSSPKWGGRLRSPVKVSFSTEKRGVLLRDQKYQKSKRGRQLLSRRRRHTRCAYVSIPLFISFCRLAATRANILPRQFDHRRSQKRGSAPRLTRTLVCLDFGFSCHVSMSIKPCSRSRSLAYSGKHIKSHGGSQFTPSNLLAFCGILCSHARYG